MGKQAPSGLRLRSVRCRCDVSCAEYMAKYTQNLRLMERAGGGSLSDYPLGVASSLALRFVPSLWRGGGGGGPRGRGARARPGETPHAAAQHPQHNRKQPRTATT